jgi:hypothetical protein
MRWAGKCGGLSIELTDPKLFGNEQALQRKTVQIHSRINIYHTIPEIWILSQDQVVVSVKL